MLGWRCRGHIAIVLDGRSARRRSLLGLDQDHAVRAAAAIDRGRGRVFQNGDRRDVRRVEQVQRVARQRGRAANAVAGRFGRHVIDGHAVDHVQRVVGVADGAATANQDLRPGAGLAIVLDDVDASSSALDHLIDVGDHADVRRRGADRRNRSRDRLPALGTVAGHHHRLENRRRRQHGQLHRGRAAGRDGDVLELRTVPDPRRPQAIGARRDAVDQETSVGVGELAVRRSRDRDFDVRDGLLGRAVDDFPRHGASGVLRAEWDDPKQTSSQCENDMTG